MISLLFDTGIRRSPAGLVGRGVRAFAVATAIWTVYGAAFSNIDSLSLIMSFLSLMLVLTFVLIGPSSSANKNRIHYVDWVMASAAAVCGGYFVSHADVIAQRITLLDQLTNADVFFASCILVLTVEAMRRTVGVGLTLIVLTFMVYNLFGHHLGGALGHGLITYTHFLDIIIFTTDGLFGVPLRVAGTYAFLFVLFGTTLSYAGGSKFFYNLAAYLTGGSPGGPAKIAVISSGLYGTISGSPTSDVVTTGAVTIPMMQKMGYRARFAGAVEVAASTGGSLLPPVMGAAAFIMAEFTGIDYVDIAFAALIPALLYYIPIYVQVHLRAQRDKLAGVDRSQIPSLKMTMREGGLFIVPLIAITWALVQGYTPTYAAIYGVVCVLVVSMFRGETRLSPQSLYNILAETSIRTVSVAGACAAAGLVIGGITMTGLATKFSTLIFMVSGDAVFPSMIIAALLTTLLGMGMPTPSAYILAAVLISPVLKTLGIADLSGHLFLLYFAVMSALTPPVAVAAYAASAIANTNPLGIAVQSVKIAIGAFLIPFCFIYNPPLLLQGSILEIVLTTVSAICGLVVVAIAVEGYWKQHLPRMARLALFTAGILFLSEGYITSLMGLAVVIVLIFFERFSAQRVTETPET